MSESQPVPDDTARRSPRSRPRWGKILKITAVTVVAVVGLAAAGAYFTSERLARQIHRTPDVFAGLDESTRPPPTSALDVLLVGSDSLADGPTTGSEATEPAAEPGGQRSDAIMLVHIYPDFTRAAVVSIPRDSWVDLPGHGKAKINASYAYGGPSLLVDTVEKLTGIRVDHFAVIDFAGLQALVDAVGGIDVSIDRTTTFGALTLRAGLNHLNGAATLGYVRQRKGLPAGDLDRVQRHQNAVRALLTRATEGGLLSSPVRTYGFLDEFTRWVTVDDTLTNSDLRSLGWSLRNLRPENVTFLTAPVAGLGRESGQSVVYLDAENGGQLWHSMSVNDVAGYVRTHPGTDLGGSTP